MYDKLHRMDQALSIILSRVDQAKTTCQVVFILGDHGMTEDGNHGGGTILETNAALFAHYSAGCGNLTPSLDIVTIGKETGIYSKNLFESIHQIDLVPTISLLLGLPIPFSKLGGAVPFSVTTTESAIVPSGLTSICFWYSQESPRRIDTNQRDSYWKSHQPIPTLHFCTRSNGPSTWYSNPSMHRSQTIDSITTHHHMAVTFDPQISTQGRYLACSGGWDWALYSKTCDNSRPSSFFSFGIVKPIYTLPVPSVIIYHAVPRIYNLVETPKIPMINGSHADFQLDLDISSVS